MKRRDLIKALGLTLGATTLSFNNYAKIAENKYEYIYPSGKMADPDKPVTAITIGAGGRGNVYGNFAHNFPQQMNIVGVAEPHEQRRESYVKKHNIDSDKTFTTWEHVFDQPKFADAVIISTPDDLHYAPCMKALEMGYDILLEKPIAPTVQECLDILELAEKNGNIVAVCHVLRYAPYFVKMKELIADRAIGEVISIQHFEPIEHVHMAHSYVRGNWHNSKETTPIILAKSCHDLDIMKWIIDKPSKKIAAMGDLKWFKKENAPEGSTARCTDGCAVEQDCPYSALKIYHKGRRSTFVFNLSENKENHGDEILEKLKTTNYGRCVYRMENDQPDHYVTSIQFDEGITANFSMQAFTSYAGRRTRVMGSMGDMVGDMKELVVSDFRTGEKTTLVPKAEDVENYRNSGHGGGDWLLMRDFVQAVSKQDSTLLTSTISDSIESHMMGFMAEESRKTGKIMDIRV
ncbi:Gfo/Idh/MocA family oxidoreductase [Litoribacter alkaliphilus]|uniref:Gfo/Idh/MocA family oxidoreductase n=1 Tax=Litoribacter ruber TaxID=702568 RepID=A0AAP2G653_9BACT|nr:Gfo/Idh/MocA family oxidoreductase [Litoribacter alkaliphilus]MBS9525711.1 Gfo/Idh/MocA family oxidoreductase [Litoribacter alkaliphilus]